MLKYLRNRRERFSDDLTALWLTEEGRVLAARGITADLEGLMEWAGIDKPDSCHIFRRSWARDSIKKGVPLAYLRAKGGWTSNRMPELYTKGMELEESAANEAYRGWEPFGG